MSVQNNPYSETFTENLIYWIKENKFRDPFYVVYMNTKDSIYLSGEYEGVVLATCRNVKIKTKESSNWITAVGHQENPTTIQYVSFEVVDKDPNSGTFTSVVQVNYDGTNCVLSTPRNINNNILNEMKQTRNLTTDYLNDYLLDCLEDPFTPLYYNTTVLADTSHSGNNITLAYTLRGKAVSGSNNLDYPGLVDINYFEINGGLYQVIKNYVESTTTQKIDSWHYGVGNEDLVYAWDTNNTPWYIGKTTPLTMPDSVNQYYHNNCGFLYDILNKEMTNGVVYYFNDIAIDVSTVDKIIATVRSNKPATTYQVKEVTLRRHEDKKWMTVEEYNNDSNVDYSQIDYIKYYIVGEFDKKWWWYCCVVEVTTQIDSETFLTTVQFASPRNCGYDSNDDNKNNIWKMIEAISPNNYNPNEDDNYKIHKEAFNNLFQDCLENPFAFMYYSKEIAELFNGNVLYLCYQHLFYSDFIAYVTNIQTYDIFASNSNLSNLSREVGRYSKLWYMCRGTKEGLK